MTPSTGLTSLERTCFCFENLWKYRSLCCIWREVYARGQEAVDHHQIVNKLNDCVKFEDEDKSMPASGLESYPRRGHQTTTHSIKRTRLHVVALLKTRIKPPSRLMLARIAVRPKTHKRFEARLYSHRLSNRSSRSSRNNRRSKDSVFSVELRANSFYSNKISSQLQNAQGHWLILDPSQHDRQ